MTVTPAQVAIERDNTANTDSSSATAVGLFLGGVVAGALGVLLIGGIVVGACRLRRTKHKCVRWIECVTATCGFNYNMLLRVCNHFYTSGVCCNNIILHVALTTTCCLD